MIRREKVHALILGRTHVGEADRLLHFFTRNHGIVRVVAKGVRKIPSRRGGHLEPLTHVVSIIAGGSDRHFLAAVETLNAYPALRRQPAALLHAQALAHATIGLFQEEESQPTLFDALHHAWELLPSLSAPRQRVVEVAFLLHALHCAGVAPDLSRCRVCAVRTPTEAVVLDNQQGGWHCLSCHTSLAGARASLSPPLLAAARYIIAEPQRALRIRMNEEESQQFLTAIRYYIALELERTSPSWTEPQYTRHYG